MDITLTSAAIATLISALTSSIVTILINKSNRKKQLDDQLDSILKISIQYPYLESESFTKAWTNNKNSDDEVYLRYDVYCTLLFNYLSRVCDYYSYKSSKIENYIAIKEWIRLHKDYWQNPCSSYENVDGYNKKFRDMINNYLK